MLNPTFFRLGLLAAGLALAARAQALEAPLAADTHVSTTAVSSNFGTLPTVNVGGGSTGLLRFDLSTLPSGLTSAKLVKASLVLYINRVGVAGAIELQTVNSAWSEAAVTAAAMPATSGAGSGPVVPVGSAGQFVAVDLTKQVKQWIDNPGANFGLALAPALSAPATTVFLDSKENTGTGHVARLDLTLADQGPPGPRGATGATGATGAPGAPGATGATGATGAQGPKGDKGDKGDTGATGAAGPQGPSGVVAIASLQGTVAWGAAVPVSGAGYVFIGPTGSVTTTAAQRVTASATWTATPSAAALLRWDVCYRSGTGTELNSPASGYKLLQSASGARQFVAASNTFVPGAGTWVVGPCVRADSNSTRLNLIAGQDDWASGWAMVTN